ncbi:hypothetical protein PRIPAC_77806 [Pristionchus pacificus]|uniref:SHSP domain-containing protein n=1 Tax=Pristionchus pacificus TaxID=54126 RepID=A0A2A6CK15_PRIPA|nr:hypothetical protein PRIPAC_77806 [Pristionchus pacificus]|eukprot:PDM78469.1 hypothetical protein PRIPAC_31048 [Pristionchus pacificus]
MSESPSASPIEPTFLWDWPLQPHDGVVEVQNDEDKFEVHLDTSHLNPNEIKVRVIGRLVDIYAEHKAQSGPIRDVDRSYSRTYKLPDDVNEAAVHSYVCPRGYLVISANKKTHISYPEKLIIHDYS